MRFSKIHSAQPSLLLAGGVSVEIDISTGLPTFNIIGLGDKSINEARDRVISAIKNAGFKSPRSRNFKTIISLAPADARKTGAVFDLPIAISYLKAAGEIDFNPQRKIFVGELSLDGKLKPIAGILSVLLYAKKNDFTEIFIPKENRVEAELISGMKIFAADNINDIVKHLDRKNKFQLRPIPTGKIVFQKNRAEYSLFDILGQENAKRALTIAAAGGHNIGLYGPPGTGKTLLAKSLSSILPNLSIQQIIACTSIHSITKGETAELITRPPFRSPHHTSSESSIIGGGSKLKPGEITLAHNGVLFLDEFPEFNRRVIEGLREPLESNVINVSRLNEKVTFPARFILVAAMNPCPCGYYRTDLQRCTCSMAAINRYRKKISGPIHDRIDMWVEVGNINYKKDKFDLNGEQKTNDVRKQIEKCRQIQKRRYKLMSSSTLNTNLSSRNVEKFFPLNKKCRQLMNNASKKLNLSVRAYYKVIKIARTIADLEECAKIKEKHLLEALRYRTHF